MLIMEIMKVLCQWSGFLNFEGVKTNESKYDSIELTDLENGGLTSSNVQLLALWRFQNRKNNSRNVKKVNKSGSVIEKRSELILIWSRLDIEQLWFLLIFFSIWWNTCHHLTCSRLPMPKCQDGYQSTPWIVRTFNNNTKVGFDNYKMLAEYLVLYLKILRGSAREPTVAFLLVFYGIVLVLSFSLSHLLWFNAQAEKS